jgi:hypothetical protein
MRATTKTYYTVDHYDNHWIREATRQVLASIGAELSEDIEFDCRETGLQFAKEVLQRYAALLDKEVDRPTFLSSRDLDRARAEIGMSPSCASPRSLNEGRFIGFPELQIGEWGQVILHRDVEVRISSSVEVVKTVVVDGEEFTRKTAETVHSSWYPAFPVKVSIAVCEHKRVEVS